MWHITIITQTGFNSVSWWLGVKAMIYRVSVKTIETLNFPDFYDALWHAVLYWLIMRLIAIFSLLVCCTMLLFTVDRSRGRYLLLYLFLLRSFEIIILWVKGAIRVRYPNALRVGEDIFNGWLLEKLFVCLTVCRHGWVLVCVGLCV